MERVLNSIMDEDQSKILVANMKNYMKPVKKAAKQVFDYVNKLFDEL